MYIIHILTIKLPDNKSRCSLLKLFLIPDIIKLLLHYSNCVVQTHVLGSKILVLLKTEENISKQIIKHQQVLSVVT